MTFFPIVTSFAVNVEVETLQLSPILIVSMVIEPSCLYVVPSAISTLLTYAVFLKVTFLQDAVFLMPCSATLSNVTDYEVNTLSLTEVNALQFVILSDFVGILARLMLERRSVL